MAKSPSKIIFGTEPEIARAITDWALIAPELRLVPCPIDWKAAEYLDFSALDAFRPEDATLFLAMGDRLLNYFRGAAYEYIEKAGFAMPSLIHPQSLIDPRATLGQNCWIGQGTLIAADAKCGPNLILNAGVAIHAGCRLSNHISIGEDSKIGRNSRIGDYVIIGPNVTIREGATIGDQSAITKPGHYGGDYPAGTFITDEFSALILTGV